MLTFNIRHRHINPIQFSFLVKWIIFAFIAGICGMLFVCIKNQQHSLGEQVREIERDIHGMQAHNDALMAKISILSSRSELQRKLDSGFISLMPIQDSYVARLEPAVIIDDAKGTLRTASVQTAKNHTH